MKEIFMNNMFRILILTTTALTIASPLYASDSEAVKSKVEYKKDGGYEASRTSEQTTTSGTTNTSNDSTNVDIDSKGYTEKTVKSETTSDPKGMMNKEKDNSETKVEEKARGGYKQTTIRKHVDASGTNTTYKTMTDVDVDANGNVTTTATTEKTTDPKGMMNETTTKTKTKSINGKVIEDTKKVN
ncbi:MAG: hypothetical protein WCJ33_02220 [Pseudomonadota bacterium]